MCSFHLADDFGAPAIDLITGKMDSLLSVPDNAEVLFHISDLILKSQNFHILFRTRSLIGTRICLIIDFQRVKLVDLLLVGLSEVFQLLLILTNGSQKGRVSLLSRQELMHHLLDVRRARARPNLLKSLFHSVILAHL